MWAADGDVAADAATTDATTAFHEAPDTATAAPDAVPRAPVAFPHAATDATDDSTADTSLGSGCLAEAELLLGGLQIGSEIDVSIN